MRQQTETRISFASCMFGEMEFRIHSMQILHSTNVTRIFLLTTMHHIVVVYIIFVL